GIIITNAGSGYTSAPTITMAGGATATAQITIGGSGYIGTPSIALVGGAFSGGSTIDNPNASASGAVSTLNPTSGMVIAVAGTANLNTGTSKATFAGSNNLNLSGVIQGAGSVTKAGSSVLTYQSSTNTYTGITTVSAGTLSEISGVAAFGGQLVVSSGAT